MDDMYNFMAKRQERFEHWRKWAPIVFPCMVGLVLLSVLIHRPSPTFIGLNILTGLIVFASWWFSIKGKESTTLVCGLAGVICALLSLPFAIGVPIYFLIPQGIGSAIASLFLCFLYSHYAKKS